MELKFKESGFPYLSQVVGEIQNLEQTQEMKLSDGMPDIDRILGAWGQTILRSKEWRSDSVLLSGGMMVWVLYFPEDGSEYRVMDSWIPFQIKWDLSEDCNEGTLCVQCMTRFVDARSVSPRKIMVRAGVTAMGRGYSNAEATTFEPESNIPNFELLRARYPLQLPKESGESSFQLDEDMELSAAENPISRLIYYTVDPEITDKKVIGNKIAFRGNGNLHVLYETEDGKMESQDYLMPFSQFSELETAYGSDAEVSMDLGVTNLEVETEANGQIRARCGLVSQYVISDRQMVETIEDVYFPGKKVTTRQDFLELPVQQETRRVSMRGEQSIPGSIKDPVDVRFLTDFARQRKIDGELQLEAPGTMQILYYGDRGELQSSSFRLESNTSFETDGDNQYSVRPLHGQQPSFSSNGGNTTVKVEMPVEITSSTRRDIPVISGVEMEDGLELDINRPSLILRRAGNGRLWDIAKSSGSTMDAIRNANHLEGDPVPDQMLLIPVL